MPYFPLGGFSPLQSDALEAVAERLGASPMAVALAWLLQRSPNMLLIPGTSSVAHLRENVAGAGLELPPDAKAELDAIGGVKPCGGLDVPPFSDHADCVRGGRRDSRAPCAWPMRGTPGSWRTRW